MERKRHRGEEKEEVQLVTAAAKRPRYSKFIRRQLGYGANRTFKFKRGCVLSTMTIVCNGVVTSSTGAYSFKLSDLPNYTEFTALFDRYRITGVRLQVMPRISQQTVGGNATAATAYSPVIAHTIDYDDATTPADINAINQYDSVKYQYEYKPFKVWIRPRAAQAQYGSGVFTSYGNSNPKQWMDVASPDITYYGWKWATNGYSAQLTGNQYWDVMATYYLEFMNPR